MEQRLPTQHSMTRRAAAHDYTLPGFYHIMLNVEESLGQVLGAVVGNLNAPDGSTDDPHVALSPTGKMVEHELLHTLTAYYPMVHVDTYAIMPEHLHLLLEVKSKLHNREGKPVHLGQVIAGYKKGCNRHFWEITGQKRPQCSGETAAHSVPSSLPAGKKVPSDASSGLPAGKKVPSDASSGLPAGKKVPSDASSGRAPLFAPGYCDVMPMDARQLATQRQYIGNNPRLRLLRSSQPWLHIQRGGIETALTPAALSGYLSRECDTAIMPEEWQTLSARLLMAPDGTITCDTYGNRAVLTDRRCLPVVCHRRDIWDYYKQKARCLEEAAKGAVLVSARIAKGEREIMDEAVRSGYTVVLIADNGFTDRYHPSAERMDLCAEGRVLMIAPWQYKYRAREEKISVPVCKTMNCLAQALCRTKDSWWQEP